MHILVPLDGSTFAEGAIESAATLLRRTTGPGSLTLLRVIGLGGVAYDISGLAAPITESASQAAIEGGQDYLAQVATRRPLHGIRVETIVQLGGTVAVDICLAAQELGGGPHHDD